MSGEQIASEAERLLKDAPERWRMKKELERVASLLAGDADGQAASDPIRKAADVVQEVWAEQV
jgi:hypothetical protein